MRTFSIDKNNDLFIGPDGNLQFSEKDDAVKNLCQHFAKAVRGEMLHKKIKAFRSGQQPLVAKLISRCLKRHLDNV